MQMLATVHLLAHGCVAAADSLPATTLETGQNAVMTGKPHRSSTSTQAEVSAGISGAQQQQPVPRCGHLPGANGHRAFNTGEFLFHGPQWQTHTLRLYNARFGSLYGGGQGGGTLPELST